MTMALSVQSGMLLCEVLRYEARVGNLSAVASAKADRKRVVRSPGKGGSKIALPHPGPVTAHLERISTAVFVKGKAGKPYVPGFWIHRIQSPDSLFRITRNKYCSTQRGYERCS